MPHANSPLTRTGRHRMVKLVEERGLTFEAAAAASNVAKSTVHLWVSRWRAASSQERVSLACLEDRSSRPRRSPSKLSAFEHDRVCELRRRTGWGPRLIASEAEQALTAALASVDRGELRSPSRVTFAEASDAWLRRKKPVLEASTYRDYDSPA